MPGTYGIHHIGVTVPNIPEAVGFFAAVFGAVKVLSTGPFDVSDEFMSNALAAAPKSRIKDLVMLRCGNGANIELFEYSGDGEAFALRSSQVGGSHVCFEVPDARASAERLKAMGVEFLDGPPTNGSGALGGLTWFHLRPPWGLMLELMSFGKLGYEAGTNERLWRSKR